MRTLGGNVTRDPQLDGRGDSYEEARRLAEEGARFALDRDDVELKHFVPAPAA